MASSSPLEEDGDSGHGTGKSQMNGRSSLILTVTNHNSPALAPIKELLAAGENSLFVNSYIGMRLQKS